MKRKTNPVPPDKVIWLPDAHYESVERRNDELIGSPKIDYYLVGIVSLGVVLVIMAVVFFGSINGG